jgi:hypothetical protein
MCFHQSKVRKATALFAAQSSAVALLPESSAIIEHVELPTADGMALLETHFGHIARSECPDPFVDVCLHHRQHPQFSVWFMTSNNIHQPGMISHWTYGLWAGFQRLKELHQSKLGHLVSQKMATVAFFELAQGKNDVFMTKVGDDKHYICIYMLCCVMFNMFMFMDGSRPPLDGAD